jgi:hypothetical protein
MDDTPPLSLPFVRICVRCKQKMKGYDYQTIYGIFVAKNGKRIPVSGEPIHYPCCPPPDSKPRATPHDAGELGESHYARTTKNIEPGIDLQSNGRYAVRINKKRLGTYATLDEAQQARKKYLKGE